MIYAARAAGFAGTHRMPRLLPDGNTSRLFLQAQLWPLAIRCARLVAAQAVCAFMAHILSWHKGECAEAVAQLEGYALHGMSVNQAYRCFLKY